MYKGLIVLDVDGVIFRSFFLGRLIRYKSFIKFIKIIGLGIKYYKNKIGTEELLKKGYSMAKGISADQARIIARKIKRVKNVVKTIDFLKQQGYFISILSAGVPNFILNDLAKELKADHYSGLEINPASKDLGCETIKLISKDKIIENLIKKLNLSWDNVVSIGDDPYNLALFKKSRLSIGFNPSKVIRDEASIIIEGNDFLEIIPHILPSSDLPISLSREHFLWKKELFRKLIHLSGIAIPFLTNFINKEIIIYSLALLIVFYIISELLRHHGLSTILISKITKKAQRYTETRNIIFGPVLLGIGILLTLLLFEYNIYTPSILIVSISDTLSALVGLRFGKHRIFKSVYSTIEGSLAFFFSALAILIFFCPFYAAITTAIIATVIEIIPIYNLDNIAIPLVASAILYFFKTGLI